MVEAAFSDDGKYYSLISNDGRLKIWDTETNVLKQEYTPEFHLSAPPTCLQWVDISLNSSPQKKSSNNKQGTQCIALGTTHGKILLYSVAQAKVETVIEKGTKKIESLDWLRNHGLFSISVDQVVTEWDIRRSSVKHTYNLLSVDAKKVSKKPSVIKIVPHNQGPDVNYMVIASVKMKLWKFEKNKCSILTTLGSMTSDKNILRIASLGSSTWLLEGSRDERILGFWDITIKGEQQNGETDTPKKKKCKMPSTIPLPTYNFVLEDAPKFVDINMSSEGDGKKLAIVAATRSGVVHYYGHMLNGTTIKPIKPSVTIQISTADAHPLPLACCRLPDNGDVLLGYMNGPAMLFERVTPDASSKTQVLIRGEAEAKKLSKSSEAIKERPAKSSDVKYVEPLGGVSRKRPEAGATVEVTMEARLQNLALDLNSRSKAPVSHNLTKLLIQALHSDDKGLILTVLQKDDIAVASRTVSSLPAEYVPVLLEKLVDMATKKTSQCSAVCTWVSALLKSHSALLLASMNAKTADQVTQLLAIFTHRRSNLCQLLNLKGRLELTIAQRKTNANESTEQEAVLNYKDGSSDEEMEVDQSQSSGDEAEWEDGDESASDQSDE
ncbi:WD repeat-containing protein 43 [Zerene cesonia]|uniref:WD repeat-containing protein 43 n=1 Tax=Zerene cesonia TaxID=33412 RepID=UPI0018E4F948|nr:WD repeat-containing protein 43 [Zerene cesonia]